MSERLTAEHWQSAEFAEAVLPGGANHPDVRAFYEWLADYEVGQERACGVACLAAGLDQKKDIDLDRRFPTGCRGILISYDLRIGWLVVENCGTAYPDQYYLVPTRPERMPDIMDRATVEKIIDASGYIPVDHEWSV